MTDMHVALRSADPAAREGGLASDDVRRMRAAVLGARPARHAVRFGTGLVAMCSVFLLVLVAVVLVERYRPAKVVTMEPTAPAPIAAVERPTRQLQFALPGGTTLIWVFGEATGRGDK
jgi:hypothetical protein